MTNGILLEDNDWRARVLPEVGGSLAECMFRGQAILEPVKQETPARLDSVELCYFPLLPFTNRIMNSRLSFEGRTIELRPNLVGYPHALHGHGWQARWDVTARAASRCTLSLEHPASEQWPWDYRAFEIFAIDAGRLTITLGLVNLSANRMPAGVGFHPFFPRPDAACLAALARCLWDGSAEQFPNVCVDIPAACDFARARAVGEARGMDHCYSGWSGHAEIEWRGAPFRVALEAERLAHFMLYVPKERDFFCFEPVSHAINAFNFSASAEGAALAMAPGAKLVATMTLKPTPR